MGLLIVKGILIRKLQLRCSQQVATGLKDELKGKQRMAKFELPIYGADDEIIKTYTANHVSWAVYIKSAEMETSLKNKSALEQMNACGDILKEVFIGLTDDDLMKADGGDVMNTFAQIVTGGQNIKGGQKKNG